LIRLLLNRW